MCRISILSLILLLPSISEAGDLFRYRDAAGREHFVDSPEKIPEEFRAQVNSAPAIREISRSRAPIHEVKDRPRSKAVTARPSGGAKGKVELFVTSWCGYCKKLETFLGEKKIAFTRYDIEADAKAKQLYDSIGGDGGVPVTRVGSKIISGFQPESIMSALGKH